MRILGLCGSPRKNGNSTTLLLEALQHAKEKGAETAVIHVSDLFINHCIHCDNCFETGKCIFDDDINIVLQELSKCDVLFIASPLHFGSVSSQLKALIDRMQILFAHKYVLKTPVLEMKPRKAFFITTATRNDPNMFDGSIEVIKSFLRCADITLENTYKFPNLDTVGDAEKRVDYVEKCQKLGDSLFEKI